jgi:hypothetical protein
LFHGRAHSSPAHHAASFAHYLARGRYDNVLENVDALDSLCIRHSPIVKKLPQLENAHHTSAKHSIA